MHRLSASNELTLARQRAILPNYLKTELFHEKVYGSAAEALDGLLFDGMFIASGGFGLSGIPELLLGRDPRCRHQGYDICIQ